MIYTMGLGGAKRPAVTDFLLIVPHSCLCLASFDHTTVDIIFAEGFKDGGLGSAIMNRLLKAAGNAMLVESPPT